MPRQFRVFICLHQVFAVACRILSCSMWDLVPWSEMEHRPPALRVQSLSHWTTREVPSRNIYSLHAESLDVFLNLLIFSINYIFIYFSLISCCVYSKDDWMFGRMDVWMNILDPSWLCSKWDVFLSLLFSGFLLKCSMCTNFIPSKFPCT